MLSGTQAPNRFGDVGERRRRWFRWDDEQRRGARATGYVVAIIVNLIMLWGAGHLLEWGVPFITPAFTAVLWAIDLSLGATILANLLFLAYDARWFRRLTQIGLNAIAFFVGGVMYGVFPFDFGDPMLNGLVRLAILVVMVLIALATVAEFIALAVGGTRHAASE